MKTPRQNLSNISKDWDEHTQQGSAEELIRLNLVKGRLEEDAILAEIIFLNIINRTAELLGLKTVQVSTRSDSVKRWVMLTSSFRNSR